MRNCYVDIGAKVHTGQIIADIDTPELDQQVQAATSAVEQAEANLENTKQALLKAESDLRSAKANVRRSQTDLQYFTVEVKRYQQLFDQGAVSLEDRDARKQAYDSGEATLDSMAAAEKSAESMVKSATAAVHVAEAALNSVRAQRDQIAATRSFKQVRASFDGIITQRNFDAGALVTAGNNSTNTVIFEVAKTDPLRIIVFVPEQYVPYIVDDEKAVVNVQAYPGRDFAGTVSHIAGGLDNTSKTLQVRLIVPNGDGKLLPGMYA